MNNIQISNCETAVSSDAYDEISVNNIAIESCGIGIEIRGRSFPIEDVLNQMGLRRDMSDEEKQVIKRLINSYLESKDEGEDLGFKTQLSDSYQVLSKHSGNMISLSELGTKIANVAVWMYAYFQ